ncbi:hypothetical protein Nepgr_001492 [Nepenthes gracilis]|uniref:Peptidase A1 domain-containing protein n=1 Tax=Nepenthes gracilis TaxID=150966 RepID=A0AAD3P581_NEPGR|nr:hypothetical protein Nepgr_001492 [Nepenthes gracilis]
MNRIIIYLFYSLLCASTNGIHGFRVKLLRRDLVDTRLFPKNITLEERYKRFAELSDARILQLRSITGGKNASGGSTPDMVKPQVHVFFSNVAVVQVAVGIPPYHTYLILDSGSDLTWVQCVGCHNCFPIKNGPFNYKQSSTFDTVKPGERFCELAEQNLCIYIRKYGASECIGILGYETFTFTSDDGSTESHPNVVFGCALETENIALGEGGEENPISGIMGLGMGDQSILKQQSGLTKGRFSYCLPPWFAGSDAHSFLSFGDDAQIAGTDVIVVPLVLPHYHLHLLDISIGGQRLGIDPKLFELKPDGSGGFLIDSGTGFSRLITPAYDAVKNGVVRHFQQLGIQPVPEPTGQVGLCYALPIQAPLGAFMTFHMVGADLDVGFGSVFMYAEGKTEMCMGILPVAAPGPNLLGAMQQANYRFLYDTVASTLSYTREICVPTTS